jgi:hypothetical protein
LEARVQATAHENLAALQASFSREWSALDEAYMQIACRPYRRSWSRASPLAATALNRAMASSINKTNQAFLGLPKHYKYKAL